VSDKKQELLTHVSTLVHPKLFGGVHVTHLFVLCVYILCLVLNVASVSGFLDCQFLIALPDFSNVNL